MFVTMVGVSLCRMELPPHGTRIPDGGVRIRGPRELRSGGIVVSADVERDREGKRAAVR